MTTIIMMPPPPQHQHSNALLNLKNNHAAHVDAKGYYGGKFDAGVCRRFHVSDVAAAFVVPPPPTIIVEGDPLNNKASSSLKYDKSRKTKDLTSIKPEVSSRLPEVPSPKAPCLGGFAASSQRDEVLITKAIFDQETASLRQLHDAQQELEEMQARLQRKVTELEASVVQLEDKVPFSLDGDDGDAPNSKSPSTSIYEQWLLTLPTQQQSINQVLSTMDTARKSVDELLEEVEFLQKQVEWAERDVQDAERRVCIPIYLQVVQQHPVEEEEEKSDDQPAPEFVLTAMSRELFDKMQQQQQRDCGLFRAVLPNNKHCPVLEFEQLGRLDVCVVSAC